MTCPTTSVARRCSTCSTDNGDWAQFSVFFCELNETRSWRVLRGQIRAEINHKEDQVLDARSGGSATRPLEGGTRGSRDEPTKFPPAPSWSDRGERGDGPATRHTARTLFDKQRVMCCKVSCARVCRQRADWHAPRQSFPSVLCNNHRDLGRGVFPRPSGRGLIEARRDRVDPDGLCDFPRPSGRGLIEATLTVPTGRAPKRRLSAAFGPRPH
jgi:CRISPR/Cas system-associated endoribonuclease Cas2